MESSDLEETTDTECPVANFDDVVANVDLLFSSFGILTNMFCVIIFTQILLRERYEGNMYKYLMVKAAVDMASLVSNILEAAYYCATCNSAMPRSYFLEMWFVWFYYFFQSVCNMHSGFLEAAATFDCLITINKWLAACQSHVWFIVVNIVSLAVCIIFNVHYVIYYEIFEMSVVINASNRTDTIVGFAHSWVDSDLFNYIDMAHCTVRDIVTLFIICLLNGLILISLKKATQRKKKLLNNNSTTQQHHSVMLINAAKAERNKIKMIGFMSCNFFLGHIMLVVYNVSFFSDSPWWECLLVLSLLPFNLSYSTSIFFYFHFNSTFKKYSLRNVRCISPNPNTVSPNHSTMTNNRIPTCT